MLENLDASYGLVFSQPVLLALVESGMTRDDAYRAGAAQRDAHVGGAPPVPRRARATTPTSPARSATSASPRASTSTAALANVDRTFDALDALDDRWRLP